MISIIIPVYNMADKLSSCLDSILTQTILPATTSIVTAESLRQPVEIILVNDGSTDNIHEVINNYKPKFLERGIIFKDIHQENQGSNPTRNKGFHESKGEYLIFCDSDIIMKPTMLETMLKTLEENPQASYAYSSFMWGSKIFRLWPFDAERLKQMPYIHTTSLIRREHFPGFDESIKRLQDWDVWLTMLKAGYVGVWIDEVLYKVNTGGTISNWLPSFAYKLMPFLPAVKKYRLNMAIVKKKHDLE